MFFGGLHFLAGRPRHRREGALLLRPCERSDRKTTGQSGAQAGRGKMAAAAVAEFQRAQSLLGTDRNASIDILHSIGKYNPHSMALERKIFYAQTLKLCTPLSNVE